MSSLRKLTKEILNIKSNDTCISEIDGGSITFNDLSDKVKNLSRQLQKIDAQIGRRLVGIAMTSSADWVVADFALLEVGSVSLPLPLEFSNEQLEFLLRNVDYCLVSDNVVSQRILRILPDLTQISPEGKIVYEGRFNENCQWAGLSKSGVVKIIHTSGTTSNPKGVLIKDSGIGLLLETLLETYKPMGSLDYLSFVPFSLLIEQVLGIYLPLATGGSISVLPHGVPSFGTQIGEAESYLKFIKVAKPNFTYMPPKLIEEIQSLLSTGAEVGDVFGSYIPCIITGGAKVNKSILEDLDDHGVTVYEAYGLSEHSSLVTLNTLDSRKVGSPGKFLPYVTYRIEDGELCIKSPTLSPGYLSKDSTSCDITSDGFLKTGDIVEIGEDGFLTVLGRKKHVIILSNARNICPEWVESVYKKSKIISDMVVIGEGMDSLSAIVFAEDKSVSEEDIKREISLIGESLSLFSKVTQFLLYSDNQGFRKKYYTLTGRPKRDKITNYFKAKQFVNLYLNNK